MNFFSDDIVNRIIDNAEIEDILENLDDFYANVKTIFCYFSYLTINISYITGLIEKKKNKFVFYCMDTEFKIGNCPTCMIYNKYKNPEYIHYYILLICTKHKFKNMGYASMLLNGFIERVKEENKNNKVPVKIILSSVEESVTFYEAYGFRWTRQSILDYPKLMEFEQYEKGKEYFILEYIIE